jgi:predicted AlkP superfamily phosphohydrolase/phosphomutase
MEGEAMTTLVIAIDGMDPDYLRRGLEADVLPAFRSLIEHGVWGPLRSTIPPMSSPAWVCFRTGKNPGQLGFVDFFAKKEASYELELVNFKVPDPAIWQILSHHGKRVGVVAVHLTYPPDWVNGIMVSPVYARSEAYYFPAEIQAVIEAEIGKLDYDIQDLTYFIQHLMEEQLRLEENRLRLIKAVLSRGEYDFFACGFNVDRAHHFATDDDTLLQVYQNTDRIVGELLQIVQPKDTVIVSDHGGGPARGTFLINQWLTERGYLTYRGPRILDRPAAFSRERIRAALDRMGLLPLARRIIPRAARRLVPAQSVGYEMVFSDIDWSQTVAYSPVVGGIYLNLKGREPAGIVLPDQYEEIRERIIADLKTLQDPITQAGLDIEVYRREEIYRGAKLQSLPDVVLYVPFYDATPGWGQPVLGPRGKPGQHRLHGVFIASGQDIRTGKLDAEPSIVDIAPTLLHLMGAPLANDMDGRVLNIFRPESEPGQREPAFIHYEAVETQMAKDENEELLRERLRALGYID